MKNIVVLGALAVLIFAGYKYSKKKKCSCGCQDKNNTDTTTTPGSTATPGILPSAAQAPAQKETVNNSSSIAFTNVGWPMVSAARRFRVIKYP